MTTERINQVGEVLRGRLKGANVPTKKEQNGEKKKRKMKEKKGKK